MGSTFFEKIVITKSAWGPDLYDMAAWNASQVEELGFDLFDYEELLIDDMEGLAWEKDMEHDGDELDGW